MTPSVDIAILAIQQLPVIRRLKLFILWAQAIAYPLTWRMTQWVQYMTGSLSVSNYSFAVTYTTGDQVVYNYGVYESLIPMNAGNSPDISPAAWIKINNSFIGATERAYYGGGRLTLEWALNRYFQTTFRQPDSPFTPTPSDIYISNVLPDYTSFVMYPDDARSSKMYPTYSTGFLLDPPVYAVASTYIFAVNIPVAVYAAIDPNPTIAETIVRQFLDNYVASGLYYTVETY